jgi:hypothetical protein
MPNSFIVMFIPVFAVFATLVVIFLHQKGWRNLQERYLYRGIYFGGERIKMRDVSVDGVNYHHVIRIKVSEHGMYMKTIVPFNLFSKPVMIPWREITDIQDKKVMFRRFKRLVIGIPFAATIDIPERDFYLISGYIDRRK